MAIKKFNAVAGISVGDNTIYEVIDDSANVSANSLTVSSVANLGAVSNVIITGGSSGYVLKTDGSGGLSWSPDAVSTAAGSNTEIQFNDSSVFGASSAFTFDKSSNTLTVTNLTISSGNITGVNYSNSNYFVGNGALLTSLTGSNVTGYVPLATSANTASTVTTAAQPNITSLGTLTGLTVSGTTDLGTASDVKISGGSSGFVLATNGFGDLSWVAQSGGGGGSGFVGITKNDFTGDGVEDTFNLTTTPSSENAIVVNIDGLIQQGSVYNLSGSSVIFVDPPLSGQHIEITIYDNLGAGSDTQVLFNSSDVITGSSNFTFTSSNNTLQVSNLKVSGNISGGNLTSLGNITASGGTLTLDTAVIAVSGANAGIFTTGISNLNIALSGNVTMGSTTGNVTVRGNLIANYISSNTTISSANLTATDTLSATSIRMNDLYSNRTPVSVTGTDVIDVFPVNKYRTAKYTIRVNSDDGYQSLETLLIHDGSTSMITVYGSISTSGYDIVLITSDILSGNVRLLATTASTNTTVNLIGTYVAD